MSIISEFFSVALSVEYLLIIHMESKGIIYYATAPGVEVDFKLIEMFRRAIEFKELDLPINESDIEQATLLGKYLVTRAGNLCWTTLIINQKPTRFTREAIHSFTIRFENRYGRELRHLYTKFGGDVSVFKQDSMTRENVDGIIDEVFHLNLTLPHKLGFPTGKRLSKTTEKIWQLCEDMAHKTRGKILLGEVFTESKKKFGFEGKEITDSLWNLIQANYLIAIPLDKLRS